MEDKIILIMEKIFGQKVNNEITQKSCENWDSIRHLNLIIALELEFNENFEPEEISEMLSFGKIFEVITGRKNG